MDIKDLKSPKINKELASIVFIDEETNGLIVHIQGFESQIQAKEFATYMLMRSGMEYREETDCFKSSSFSIN
jgi:hypothetical protein